MIRPLRQRHRRMAIVLGVCLPIAFAVGIAARKPVPQTASLPEELSASPHQFAVTEWERADLFTKTRIQVRLLRESAGTGHFALKFSTAKELVKPDLIVYWVAGSPHITDLLPDNARLLGAFNPSVTLSLSPDNEPGGGVLVLYSLADQGIVEVSNRSRFKSHKPMGVEYVSVQWNRQKKLYDAVLVGGVAAYLAIFGVLTKILFAHVTDEIMLMRAFGTAAFLLLHVILCMGPLCRLNPKFLPLLYNRRHAGVTMFTLGLIHAILVVITYHAGGDTNPILGIFKGSPLSASVSGVPFQPFGFFALVILFLMAATSHDFWLANLSAPVWKSLHMMVYVAYALLVLHVTFGAVQGEGSPLYVVGVAFGLVLVLGLHITAATREVAADRETDRSSRPEEAHSPTAQIDQSLVAPAATDGYVDACAVADIPESRARIICLSGERVAVFKYDGKISAVSNVCQHQNGPLGEGKIVFGCITCPWHGYQYQPDTGASPPPFVEKVPTFNVRVNNGRVFVHPKPNFAGTRAEPARIDE